jgi:hypothetical protein
LASKQTGKQRNHQILFVRQMNIRARHQHTDGATGQTAFARMKG